MNFLLVEDDPEYIAAISAILSSLQATAIIRVAQSKESAFEMIEAEFFDVFLLDLKIPTVDGALDADAQHGRSVFYNIRQLAPGTPIFVLTGSPAESFIEDFLEGAQQVDIWSEGKKIRNIDFLPKYRFEEFSTRIEPICHALWELFDVELDSNGIGLSIPEDRLSRIFARKYGGTRCVISKIGGGFSGARVYRMYVTSGDGSCVHHSIAKIGTIEDIRDESERFERHVSRLEPAATPRKLCVLEFGAKRSAGVFYSLATNFDRDAFSVAFGSDVQGATLPPKISLLSKRWWHDIPETRRTIRDVRRKLLSDDNLNQILMSYPTPWVAELEARSVQVRWSCIHGDLHGKNVLVNVDGECVLIDYGDVGEGSASTDPTTLEFSLIFHPDSPFRGCGWPTVADAALWDDVDRYTENCPSPQFVKACRSWGGSVAAGKREIAISAYSYLIRQYKYHDTDKPLVAALLRAVYQTYQAT